MQFAKRQRQVELGYMMSREPSHRFTKKEDRLLEQLVEGHGTSSWAPIAACLPGRTPCQCRERWTNYLSRTAEREAPWTAEEDTLIWRKVDELGMKWTQISRMLTGRSSSQTKSRWAFMFRSRRSQCFRTASKERKPAYRQRQPDSKRPKTRKASTAAADPPVSTPVRADDLPWNNDQFSIGGDFDFFSEAPWQPE
jgi:myb proto-oncogene protein